MFDSKEAKELRFVRRIIAILRMTLGLILLITWIDNLRKGIYTADGITGLFDYIFNENGGGLPFYREIINNTILQAPGVFAVFQLVAELLLALGLLFGVLTPVVGLGATFFFLNLFFSYFGGQEWIWTYVLLTVSALTVALTRSGRAWGVDQWLQARRGDSFLSYFW